MVAEHRLIGCCLLEMDTEADALASQNSLVIARGRAEVRRVEGSTTSGIDG